MDIELLKRVTTQLEANLKLISEALNFIGKLTPEDLTPQGENSPLHSGIDSIKHSLTAYISFEKDSNKLRNFIREYIKKHHPEKSGNVLFWGYPPLLDFSQEADRILKEVDAQLNLVCDMLSVNPPGPHDNRYSGKYPSITNWKRNEKNLVEAMNIVKAAKSIIGG